MTQETYDLLESNLQYELEALTRLADDDSNKGKQVDQAIKLANMINEVDKVRVNDELEAEKLSVEKAKNELTWKKIGFEMCKVMCPAIASYVAFNIFQKRTIKFEETGRLVSTASRQLKMPNLLSR